MSGFLVIEGLRKRFGATTALDGIDLAITAGEVFALLGGSGCGKSTLLRCLAGLEQADGGRILLEGRDLSGAPAHARPVNIMFQSYALFPHMDVAANIAFGLKQEGMAKAAIAERVTEMLARVRLDGFGARRPAQLSGGQRARVALARALARHPRLLLLDEPLSALDRNLREAMQLELLAILRRTGTTCLLVTHDQQEAMAMASRIAVMERGRLVQVGTPAEVYERPESRFVATFLGAANILEGRVAAAGGGVLRVEGAGFACAAPGEGVPGEAVGIALRPERLRLLPAGEPGQAQGVLTAAAYRGEAFLYQVALPDGAELRITAPNAAPTALPAPGTAVSVGWTGDAAVVLRA